MDFAVADYKRDPLAAEAGSFVMTFFFFWGAEGVTDLVMGVDIYSPEKVVDTIIVYPLNALINSQEEALKGFAKNYQNRTGQSLPFTFKKYTKQENKDAREDVIGNPPDILLINYMMLELLIVRQSDKDLRNEFLENVKYLVYDELHVYKGRQGADVSLLNHRIKAAATNKKLICIPWKRASCTSRW